jgi:hypothetical protein
MAIFKMCLIPTLRDVGKTDVKSSGGQVAVHACVQVYHVHAYALG